MKISAQEEYGLRCLLRLACLGVEKDESLTLQGMAKAEKLTVPHVAKLMRILRQAGVVTAERGQSGGYRLAKRPEEIIVGDVLEALGGKLVRDNFCANHSGEDSLCTRTVDCSVRSLWSVVQRAVDSVLSKMTLSQLMCDAREVAAFGDALTSEFEALRSRRPATSSTKRCT